MRSSGALVVPECVQLTEAMAKVGYNPKLTVQASNCWERVAHVPACRCGSQRTEAGLLGEGPGNPIYTDDPGGKAYLADAGLRDPGALVNNTYYETGWMIADMDVNVFQTAAKSVLASVRPASWQAARNQNYQEPLFINGIKWVMNSKEAYGVHEPAASQSTRPRRRASSTTAPHQHPVRRSSVVESAVRSVGRAVTLCT